MSISNDDASSLYGFLSVFDLDELGFCGGLLVIDCVGRPIEFHCTVPVQPDRAQEILYGRTFKHFLFCDQIAKALLQKSSQELAVIFVNQRELLELNAGNASCCWLPVAMPLDDAEDWPLSEPVHGGKQTTINGQSFAVSASDTREFETTEKRLSDFGFSSFITEPFERIREAIEEAQTVCP